MNDDLIVRLMHWKHTVPTTRERCEMIEAMRDAAEALRNQSNATSDPSGIGQTPEREPVHLWRNTRTGEFLLQPVPRMKDIWERWDAWPVGNPSDEISDE